MLPLLLLLPLASARAPRPRNVPALFDSTPLPPPRSDGRELDLSRPVLPLSPSSQLLPRDDSASSANRTATARQLAKDGKLMAQWYPIYEASERPVDTIKWDYVNLMYHFVFTTAADGLDTNTGDGAVTAALVNASHANNVPVVFSVGGWDGGLFFSSLVATEEGRKSFAGQIGEAMERYGFDGVDIDWEYPNNAGIGCNNLSAQDTTHFSAFLSELRTQLGGDKLITADVSPSGFTGPDGNGLTNVSDFAASLDWINIMNYDTYGSWSPTTGPNAPLSDQCADPTTMFGAEQAVKLWGDAGMAQGQMVLGVPGYGYQYSTASSTLSTTDRGGMASEIYQNFTGTPEGDENDSAGLDVCGNFENYTGWMNFQSLVNYGYVKDGNGTEGANGFARYWDECSSTPFLFNPSNKTFVSYDDTNSTAIKASWSRAQGLAGIAFFDSTGPTEEILLAAKIGLVNPDALEELGWHAYPQRESKSKSKSRA